MANQNRSARPVASTFARLQQRVRDLRAQTYALYLASRDPRTPWYAKLLIAGVVAYALSPIDLIPDFVPVLGYLDDLILIAAGFALAIKLIPDEVMTECQAKAQRTMHADQPVSRVAAVIVVVIWLALTALCLLWVSKFFMRPEP